MKLRTALVMLLALGGSLLAGCGARESIESSRTAASGTVTFDGQPLPGGCITITSATDPQLRVSAMLQAGGKFAVADAPKGPVQVTVETETLRFGAPAELYVKIPARYDRTATSGLTATIEPAGPAALVRVDVAVTPALAGTFSGTFAPPRAARRRKSLFSSMGHLLAGCSHCRKSLFLVIEGTSSVPHVPTVTLVSWLIIGCSGGCSARS